MTSARHLMRADVKVQTQVAFEVSAVLDRRAHELGISRAEYIRDLLTLVALGRDGVLKLHEARLDSMTIFGPSEDRE